MKKVVYWSVIWFLYLVLVLIIPEGYKIYTNGWNFNFDISVYKITGIIVGVLLIGIMIYDLNKGE